MKSTKLMLAVMATIIFTWILMGTIGWCVSDLSFRDCLVNDITLFLMLTIGWIPPIVVGNDVYEYFNLK